MKLSLKKLVKKTKQISALKKQLERVDGTITTTKTYQASGGGKGSPEA